MLWRAFGCKNTVVHMQLRTCRLALERLQESTLCDKLKGNLQGWDSPNEVFSVEFVLSLPTN